MSKHHYFQVRNGHIKRITDNDIQSFVLEILGTNVRWEIQLCRRSQKILVCFWIWITFVVIFQNTSTTFITCPADPRKTLGIRLPYLIMIVKNMKKYFTFEVQVRFYICAIFFFFLAKICECRVTNSYLILARRLQSWTKFWWRTLAGKNLFCEFSNVKPRYIGLKFIKCCRTLDSFFYTF